MKKNDSSHPFAALDSFSPENLNHGAPPLEAEPPHKKLARLNAAHKRVTEDLRQLREDWKNKNLRAQATRTPVPTPEITHVETRRRELHLELERLQAEIGQTNKELREAKAIKKGYIKADPKPKLQPFKDDPEFPVYFYLAAKDTLAPKLYADIERVAKSLMHEARRMGIEPE